MKGGALRRFSSCGSFDRKAIYIKKIRVAVEILRAAAKDIE
jgi:hypothetical protein